MSCSAYTEHNSKIGFLSHIRYKSAYEKKLKWSVDSLKTKIQTEITTKRLK